MKKCGITNGYFGKFVGESKMAISNFFLVVLYTGVVNMIWNFKLNLGLDSCTTFLELSFLLV